MPRFQDDEPDVFYDDRFYLSMLTHHEAGHLFLAYYYGFDIGGFAFKKIEGRLSGSVKNRPPEAYRVLDPKLAASNEARKLVAGELSARIHLDEPTDVMSIMLASPPASRLKKQTQFSDVRTRDPRHDVSKMLGLFKNAFYSDRPPDGLVKWIRRQFGYIDPSENWWEWFWSLHRETEVLLRQFFPKVGALAHALRCQYPKIDQYAFSVGEPTAVLTGSVLIDLCRRCSVPVHDAASCSNSYDPEWFN